MVVAKKLRPWLLPLVFLAGYIVAWGTVVVDRQMLVAEQRELAREVKSAREELRLRKMMQEFGLTWEQMIIWNKEHKEVPPKKAENGKVGK